MLIFLHGSDTFRSLAKLREIKKKFLKDVEGGVLNLAELDGEKLSFADFKKEITTVSFLSSKRMIVLKNIISKSKDKDIQKKIIEYLKTDSDNENIIVFWEEGITGKEPLAKYLLLPATKTFSQEFQFLKSVQLRNWVTKKIQEKGGKISLSCVNILIERIGSDLWQMNNELDKLVNFSPEITLENIKRFVKTKDDENIFNLTDAIGAQNKKLALKLLSEQIRAGTNINYIITMLARQYRLILEVKDYMKKNEAAGDMARDLKIHPYVLQKISGQARMYDAKNLKKIYSHILDIDLKSKTTNTDIELLLDMMIFAQK